MAQSKRSNAITKQTFNQIKRELHVPADYKRVMKKFGISQTTARYIRNSHSFEFYKAWTSGVIKKKGPSPAKPAMLVYRVEKPLPHKEGDKVDVVVVVSMIATVLAIVGLAAVLIAMLTR